MRITVTIGETIEVAEREYTRPQISIEDDVEDGETLINAHRRISRAARKLLYDEVAMSYVEAGNRKDMGIELWLNTRRKQFERDEDVQKALQKKGLAAIPEATAPV